MMHPVFPAPSVFEAGGNEWQGKIEPREGGCMSINVIEPR